MNKWLKNVSFLLLAVVLPTAVAETSPENKEPEQWFQIEVLIYEHNEPALTGENWPLVTELVHPADAVNLVLPHRIDESEQASATGLTDRPTTDDSQVLNPVEVVEDKTQLPAAFEQLDASLLNLAEAAEKLKRSRHYTLVTHQAWQQPVFSKVTAKPVYLTNKPLEYIDETLAPEEAEINASALGLDAVLLEPLESDAIDQPPIDPEQLSSDDTLDAYPLDENEAFEITREPVILEGFVTVSLSRYLHMKLDLLYHNPEVYLAEQIANNQPGETVIEYFPLKESRRVRSKEIHYFDHPYFGVIATITPVERIIEPEPEKTGIQPDRPTVLNPQTGAR